jgi:histidinol-phosphate aminotransferase
MIGSPELIREIYKIKLPYNINFFSEFTASLLLKRRHLMTNTIAEQVAQRDRIYSALQKLPFDNIYPSQANFLLVRTRSKEAYFTAIKRAGILLRDVSSYSMLENCIRMSIGTPEQNTILIDATHHFFEKA